MFEKIQGTEDQGLQFIGFIFFGGQEGVIREESILILPHPPPNTLFFLNLTLGIHSSLFRIPTYSTPIPDFVSTTTNNLLCSIHELEL
jgi:hypothetical protein